MNDPLAVAVCQGAQQLFGPRQHLRFRDGPLSSNSTDQALTLYKVHHQVDVTALLEEITHADQIGVIEARENLRLLLELAPQVVKPLGVEPGLGDHLFQGDCHVQPCVPGAVYCPHAALTQAVYDAVAMLQDLSN
jgi:hypothetical protein